VVACSSDRATTPVDDITFARGGVPPSPGPATYDWHAGDAFLAGLNPAFAPAKAMAPNGDIIELSGTGTLSVFPKAVTGGGTFTHKDADGNVIGSGDWTATALVSFQDYGASPVAGFPADFRAGNALIRVHLTAAGGAVQLDGTLRITCHLPETDVPGGFVEGVRLEVDRALNFNQEAGGATLFIALP
jgi:hypothetical protein